MNESNPLSQNESPNQTTPKREPRELGDDPVEREPVGGVFAAIETVLRQPRRIMFQLRQPGSGKLVGAMLLTTVVCSFLYGVVVGSFSGHEQWWAAPVKISAGMLLSALVCLPSLYIFCCLSGSQARLREMLGLVAGLLMLTSILLIGFAPVAWLFSQSSSSLSWMGFLHLLFWSIATVFGVRFLASALIHSRARTSTGLSAWIFIFVLVVLQMSAALRPIVGRADTFLPTEKKFFLAHWVLSLEQESREGFNR